MPLKIKLLVGADTFEVEGDVMDPSIVDLAKAWVGALHCSPEDEARATKIRAIKDQLAGNTAALQAGVPETSQP